MEDINTLTKKLLSDLEDNLVLFKFSIILKI